MKNKIKHFLRVCFLTSLITSSGSLIACHTFEASSDNGKVVIPNPVMPQTAINALPTKLTSLGENARARFNADGSRIIYQSYERPVHKKSQIYTLDLGTMRERRVTYNDGEDGSPSYDPTGLKVIYASTTDELKEEVTKGENPSPLYAAALKNLKFKLLNYDIYQSDADGSHIKRLTNSKGYDSDCSYSRDGLKIIYTSMRNGTSVIFSMDADGGTQRRIFPPSSTPDENMTGPTSESSPAPDVLSDAVLEGEPSFSPRGGSIVWREGSKDKAVAQIFKADKHGKNVVQLTTKEALNINPSWSPDGKKIIFSSNRDDSKNFEIYQMNTDGTCLKRLTYAPGDDLYPTLSPDGHKLLFTSNRDGKNQIYIRDYFEPANCGPEKP